MILDIESTELLSDDQQEMVENDAENLFGLIHARYVLTNRGLHAMLEKYKAAQFGRCPRVLCNGPAVLPVGISDTTNQESVKLYCPRCEDIFQSKSSRHEHIDGAYFGTTFAHLFFLTFPELKSQKVMQAYLLLSSCLGGFCLIHGVVSCETKLTVFAHCGLFVSFRLTPFPCGRSSIFGYLFFLLPSVLFPFFRCLFVYPSFPFLSCVCIFIHPSIYLSIYLIYPSI